MTLIYATSDLSLLYSRTQLARVIYVFRSRPTAFQRTKGAKTQTEMAAAVLLSTRTIAYVLNFVFTC